MIKHLPPPASHPSPSFTSPSKLTFGVILELSLKRKFVTIFNNFSFQCFNLVTFHCCQKRSRFHSFVRGLCLGSRRCQSDIFLFNNKTLRRNKVLAGLVLIIRLFTFFNKKKSEFDLLDSTCKIVHGCLYDSLSKYEVKLASMILTLQAVREMYEYVTQGHVRVRITSLNTQRK